LVQKRTEFGRLILVGARSRFNAARRASIKRSRVNRQRDLHLFQQRGTISTAVEYETSPCLGC